MWPDPVWAVLALAVSPAVGSFLGVLVERLGRTGEKIWSPSRCETCGHRLTWPEMVPILSAIRQRGRCAQCGQAIPGHLMRIELAAVLMACLAVWRFDDPSDLALSVTVLWVLVALFYCDLTYFRLPNGLTLALVSLGACLAINDPTRTLAEAVLSGAAGFAAFTAIRVLYRLWRGREGLGAGDPKLMAGIGAALGWQVLPFVCLIAAGAALPVAALDARRRGEALTGGIMLPFGSFLAAAAAICLLI